jgi:hypothetical protein
MGSPLPADDPWCRPPGVDDATVEAVGKVSESLEWIERARGRLYDFHQMVGRADLLLDEAVELLRKAGHDEHARRVQTSLIGRNVLAGRWTYQIVEEFDDGYWEVFRAEEKLLRGDLAGGKRHLFEAEMKEARRTDGHPFHGRRPSHDATPRDTPAD